MFCFKTFHYLVKIVKAEDYTNEKIRTLDLPLGIIDVTSKLESQKLSAETHDTNPEKMCTQKTDPNEKSKLQFQKNCNFCHKSNHPVSNWFRIQR